VNPFQSSSDAHNNAFRKDCRSGRAFSDRENRSGFWDCQEKSMEGESTGRANVHVKIARIRMQKGERKSGKDSDGTGDGFGEKP
jgi:hypothetical protein